MPTVLITGGTGLIGKALTDLLLQKNYEVIILSRSSTTGNRPSDTRVRFAQWDIEKQTIDASAIRNADYIVHLAGAGVADKRWTAKRKKKLWRAEQKVVN